MPRSATVYELLIASPSDVQTERSILAEVVQDWNSAHSRARGVSISALRWELDATPAVGERPQAILNKQLVEDADILMAVFWTRLGTPTGTSISGTVEEIEHFRRAGKHVLLYFSGAAIPHNHDAEQLRLLMQYRKTLGNDTFYQTFEGAEELRRRATRDLARTMNEPPQTGQSTSRKGASDRGKAARLVLQTRRSGVIPTTTVGLTEVFAAIENLSASKRITEYSCTFSIPKCCLTFNNAVYPSELKTDDASYRKFRHTEANQNRVAIHPGDRLQVIAVEIAVDHLSAEQKQNCINMDLIADAVADGEALQIRKTIGEIVGG